MIHNRAWVLARRPEGAVAITDFALRTEPFAPPKLDEGEILVGTRVFSCAPTIRNWLNPPAASYRAAIAIGDPIRGMAACEVLASRHAGFAEGELITAVAPWQDFAVLKPDQAAVPLTIIPCDLDLIDAMTLHSPNSLTAYFGLYAVGMASAGETVLVSGAAGSVGAMVCQLAKHSGCRVVGVAGGPGKCDWLVRECGVDAAIDYRQGNLDAQVKAAFPGGINLFFDNVGGEILQRAVDHMAPHGRIVLCGQISAYDTGRPAPGPADMMKLVYGRLRMEGFVVGDFADRYDEAHTEIAQLAEAGKVAVRVDVRDGFECLPTAFVDLFAGANTGTLIVRNDTCGAD